MEGGILSLQVQQGLGETQSLDFHLPPLEGSVPSPEHWPVSISGEWE